MKFAEYVVNVNTQTYLEKVPTLQIAHQLRDKDDPRLPFVKSYHWFGEKPFDNRGLFIEYLGNIY